MSKKLFNFTMELIVPSILIMMFLFGESQHALAGLFGYVLTKAFLSIKDTTP